jgi:hypothetical protein
MLIPPLKCVITVSNLMELIALWRNSSLEKPLIHPRTLSFPNLYFGDKKNNSVMVLVMTGLKVCKNWPKPLLMMKNGVKDF